MQAGRTDAVNASREFLEALGTDGPGPWLSPRALARLFADTPAGGGEPAAAAAADGPDGWRCERVEAPPGEDELRDVGGGGGGEQRGSLVITPPAALRRRRPAAAGGEA